MKPKLIFETEDETVIELSINEARKLYDQLKEVFGNESEPSPSAPMPPVPHPVSPPSDPSPEPWVPSPSPRSCGGRD